MSTLSEDVVKELLDEAAPIAEYNHAEWRWGYLVIRVYLWDGEHWAIPCCITTGDEGGIEASDSAYRVRKVSVQTINWEKIL